jgi:RNA polymerase sigma factor (sigma-70 family)
LVLLAGVTGSGKSTTIAAMLNYINHKYRKHILTLEDPDAFRGWIFTIARRLAWRHAEVAGRSVAVANVPEKAAAAAEPAEDGERVRAALARLPERYRLPVTLHFVNGMEYGEISRTLGLANGSLRGLIARGTKKLRDDLAPWWRQRHEGA